MSYEITITGGGYNVEIAGVGQQGAAGTPGADGAPGSDGPAGPAGSPGADGADGLGWTGATYDGATGIVTFTSDDELGFQTGDLRGTQGSAGADGDNGWSPVLAVVSDGARRVHQVADWTAGEGTKPNTGQYVGPAGLVAAIGDAVDIRGAAGAAGAGSGDMTKTVYDTNDSGIVDEAEAVPWSGIFDKPATFPAATLEGASLEVVRNVVHDVQLDDTHDLNGLTDGWYSWVLDQPANAPFAYAVMLQVTDAVRPIQLAFGGADVAAQIAVRRQNAGVWGVWTEMLSSGGGASALSDLTDVDASVAAPSDGDIMVYRDAGGDFVLEAKPAAGSNPAIGDISDWPTGVDATEVEYLNGVTGPLQAQVDAKQSALSEGVFVDGDKIKLDGIEADATADQTGAEIKALYEAEADTNAFTDAEKDKVGHLSVTQAVDLDAIETRVNELDASVVLKGVWDASAGTFPGAGSAQAGWSYIVSVAGTVDGQSFAANDRIVAIIDDAATGTFAANWHKLDYTDEVVSVAGRTGAVVLTQSDIAGLTDALNTLDANRNLGTTLIPHTGPTVTIDMTAGSQHKVTTSGATTITVVPGAGDEELTCVVKVFNPGGDAVNWVGDTGVTLNKPDGVDPPAPATGQTDRHTLNKESSTVVDLLPGHTNMAAS